MTTHLQGTGDPIVIDPTKPAIVIGERINPTGKINLLEALKNRHWDFISNEARAQAEAGAAIIDVNVGGKGIDEFAILPKAVRVVSQSVDVPLSIDTRIPAALEEALRICPGRPLVNSIGGEKKILSENLPIIADFNVPVIVMCMGQNGIPDNVRDRLTIAHQVLETAVKAGIDENDIIFDPLVMAVGADDQAAHLVLETIRCLREEFPNNSITGGASNISFGMPARSNLNAYFLSTAIYLGMNLPIGDPTDEVLKFALSSGNIFLGRDRKLRSFMRFYRSTQ